MRTRSSLNLIVESFTISKRRNRRRSKQIVEPELRTIVEIPVATMADTRTMSELLQAPIEGYRDAIVIPNVLAENFELKVGLLSLIIFSYFDFSMRTRSSSNLIVESFTILKRRNRRRSKQIVEPELRTIVETPVATIADTSTMSELLQAPTEDYGDAIVIPAILAENFELKVWLLSLRFDETFSEAWDCFKDLLPTNGNILNCTPRDALTIIENKSKVRTSRNKPILSKVSSTTSSSSPSLDIIALTDIVQELLLNVYVTQQATVIAIEETCVTYGGPHPYYECLATGGNTFDASVAKLLLSKLTPTRMTLELTNGSVTYLVGVAEDVFVKVGKFYFLADFVVGYYDVNPRVPLILLRPFLRTARALIDVNEKLFDLATTPVNENCSAVILKKLPEKLGDLDLTLQFNDEAITFKVRHTSRYSRNYYEESVNRIDVIDVSCEESAQEVLGFFDSLTSGNPTPSDPIIASSSPSFIPFEGGDFILEEIETFLRTPDELSNLDDDYYDTEGDNLYLEKLLNEDPSLNFPPMKNEDLKQADITMTKPLIEEPPKLKLKDLPSHLEYAFLEGTDKLLVIIFKELKDKEKAALLKVLKSHKWAIAWKISNNKGIDPRFCTHKILIEDDFTPTVQHQRRVNPKIHETIKKEVIKLLNAELIYPISDSLLKKMLKRCEDTNLVLNREKCYFMVKEGIVLSHKISKSWIEVDRAKVDVIAKLPHPTSVKGVRSF
nr:reverse transcriptase domain-containing protein [Tanacetum cinerariifolium]